MEPKKPKRTKTNDKLLSLTKEESDKIGVEVVRLMDNEMSYLVNKYMFRYRNATSSTFGWTDDDLRQHIMIILWKGVATFDPTKKVKMTTYLSTILYYQMGNLSKRCQNDKNSLSKLYCPEDLYDSEETIDPNSTEDWSAYAQNFSILMERMSTLETKVLVSHLLRGESITRMQKSFKVKRPELISAIKSLKEKMEYYLGVIHENNRLH